VSYENKLYLVGGFIKHRIAIPQLFIYDMLTNKWTEGEPMPTPRAGLTSEFVNGILYAIGGSSGDNTGPLNTNEAYDPKTNKWSQKAPMPTARHHITSAIVEGKLYVLGGRVTDVPSNLNENEMYDPKMILG
jgi:N-acetylneuraminic acid mutarotase